MSVMLGWGEEGGGDITHMRVYLLWHFDLVYSSTHAQTRVQPTFWRIYVNQSYCYWFQLADSVFACVSVLRICVFASVHVIRIYPHAHNGVADGFGISVSVGVYVCVR